MNTIGFAFARSLPRARLAAAALLCLVPAWSALAASPKVSFDLNYQVECHDVTPQAFALLHPDEMVIEADLRVSVRLDQGDESDLEELQFELTSPAERLRIVDFVPKTEIENDTVDGTEVVKTTETIHSLGAGIGTTVTVGAGAGNVHGNVVTSALPNGSANATHRKELKETTKKIPPGKAVVASGTVENEHGVFFKLRRSARGSFEGTKPLSFRFVAPAAWRGDWIVLSCSASGRVRHYFFFKSTETVGTAKAFLALHLAGDAQAERAGLELSEAQEQYFASKPPQDRYDLIITTLATEARPWRAGSHALNLSSPCKLPVNCYKHGASKSLFRLTSKTAKCPSAEACVYLKQALDGVARFSAAPDWRMPAHQAE